MLDIHSSRASSATFSSKAGTSRLAMPNGVQMPSPLRIFTEPYLARDEPREERVAKPRKRFGLVLGDLGAFEDRRDERIDLVDEFARRHGEARLLERLHGDSVDRRAVRIPRYLLVQMTPQQCQVNEG